jgi:hypothetical protein
MLLDKFNLYVSFGIDTIKICKEHQWEKFIGLELDSQQFQV